MRYILFRLLLIIVFIGILVGLVSYARGYRINTQTGKIGPTGILLATSAPDGARIFVNGKFMGATNQNISLSPGYYDVEISKEGYTTWKSNLSVKGEVVTRADATLFPLNPSLSPLTNLGVVKAQSFPDVGRVLIIADNPTTATQSANVEDNTQEKNGVFVFDNSPRQINLFSPLKLLVGKSALPKETDLSKSDFIMSPDAKEVLFTVKNTSNLEIATYLISADSTTTNLFDVSKSKQAIQSAWDEKKLELTTKILETYKKPFADLAETAFDIHSFSLDETKIFYQAKANTTIPIIIKPRLIGTNQTPEVRDLIAGNWYVYDKKEDRNYDISAITKIPTPTPARTRTRTQPPSTLNAKNVIVDTILWHPNSTHLIIKGTNDVSIANFDSSHKQIVYSGPFEHNFLAVTGDGKLLILANLNPQRNNLPDLYAVGIK